MLLNYCGRKAAIALSITVALAAGRAQADYVNTLQNTSGLISHWSLDEVSGTTVFDSVTTDSVDGANDGTFNAGQGATLGAAGPRPSDGFIGFAADNRAVSFAGGAGDTASTHQGLVMDPSGYTGTGGLNEATMVVWFRITDSTEKHYHIGGLQKASGSGRYGLALNHYDDSGEGLRAFARVGTSEISMSTNPGSTPDYYAPTVGDPEWHMAVAVVRDNGLDKDVEVHVDGVFYDETTGVGGAGLPLSPRDWMIFGHDADLDNGRQMVGELDEIAFFDRALSTSEIQGLYASASTELVPEPSSLLIAAMAVCGALAWRRS